MVPFPEKSSKLFFVADDKVVGPNGVGEITDGRRLRVERGKQAVYEALIDLFAEGRHNPPIADVAERSGISERTIFRYFGSFNEIIAGMVGYIYPRVEPYFVAEPPRGDLFERLLALAELRIEFADHHGVVSRTTELLACQWPAAAMARWGRVDLLNNQLKKWIGDDMSRVSDAKLVVLSLIFDIPNVESAKASLGATASATLARAAIAIIDAD